MSDTVVVVVVVDDVKILEDDAFILRVIEAYCTSTKARQAVNSCMSLSLISHQPAP